MMNTDKAYILGLIIGGGIWGEAEEIFRIRLPFKRWGSYESNPERAGKISKDILRMVSPLFRAIYGISVSYDTSVSGEWNILCEGDLSALREELEGYGIACEGEVRKTANLSKIIPDLVDENLKRRFIAGLADTIGSTKSSHRRFNDDKQMVSFEISGFEFNFVCSLCKLLHSIECYPDQILWNHPNFHCGNNPYDKKWKKGFKLRVYLDQYDKFGAFAFESKAVSVKEGKALEKKENVAEPCSERKIKLPDVSCVHCDENSMLLPDVIRGGHYLHNRHVCAVLGCEHAPYSEVEYLINNAEYCITPFPVLLNGTSSDIQKILDDEPIYKKMTYRDFRFKIADLYAKSDEFLFGTDEQNGYPLSKVVRSMAYLIAAPMGKVHGTRPMGSQDAIISDYLKLEPNGEVVISVPNVLSAIIIRRGDFASIVGANNPKGFKKLIQRSADNPYKIEIRPISEADLYEEE